MLIRFLILSLKYSPALKHFPGQVMSKDKRPGVAAVFAALFEDEEQVNWNIPSFIWHLLTSEMQVFKEGGRRREAGEECDEG